jgi:hypothetical protein
MSQVHLVKCDGPNCDKQRDSRIHANTWLRLVVKETLHPFALASEDKTYDFCGYICLRAYIHNITER